MSDIHTITLNNKKIAQLPFKSDDLAIREATSQFILIESTNMHIAYDGNAVYVTLASTYRNNVRGLCGSFDYDQDNDLRLPDGQITNDTEVFGNSYQNKNPKPHTEPIPNANEKFDKTKAVCILPPTYSI